MKIGLYSPFLTDTLGGGERYLLTVAQCLLPDHQVELIVDRLKPGLLAKFKQNFNLSLNNLKLVTGPFSSPYSALARFNFTRRYDIFYYMTDGSFFFPGAKLNVLHFMIPLNQPPNFFQKLKLTAWPVKVANSFFTKDYLEKIWRLKINFVHWGAVNQSDFLPQPKKNLILSVGRFFSDQGHKHCKRQDFLVDTFIKLYRQGDLQDWQLVLNGPIDPGADNLQFAQTVAAKAKGFPIILRHHGGFKQLQQDYGQAKIYWHAAGYGVDARVNPQAVEHLGLSTVEAMAAGAVPVVINQGGQPEIVTHQKNGLLWQTQAELMAQTKTVAGNPNLWQRLSAQAIIRSKDFSYSRFCRQLKQIFQI